MTGDTFAGAGEGGRAGRRWWRRTAVGLAGLGVAGFGMGAGLAVGTFGTAAASTSSAATTTASSNPMPPRRRTRRAIHIKRGIAALGGAIHGQMVVPRPGGGYRTVDSQRGTVTAVNTSSITVKSADGFTKTYAVTPKTLVEAGRDGIGDVKAGHHVALFAVEHHKTADAANIVDRTALKAARAQWAPGFPAGPPLPMPPPMKGTASASGGQTAPASTAAVWAPPPPAGATTSAA